MKKLLVAASVATSILLGATAASALTIIPTFSAPAPDGSFSGAYMHLGIAGPTFSDTVSFTMPTGVAGATLSSIFSVSEANNITFTSATFNGTALAITSAGNPEFRSINNLAVVSGAQTLTLTGTSGGNGSYAGTLSFARLAAAVPEPGAWALMIVGFGGAGAVLRRRKTAATAA